MVMHKYYNDVFYRNTDFANLAGLHIAEVNYLEEVFLQILDFDIHVSEEELEHYQNGIRLYVKT